jgi:DNA-binding transcriptional MerR regulator
VETEYSKRDIAERLDLSVRKVTYWTDFGLVIPDVKPSRGKGKARVYSERNLIEFGMIKIMVDELNINLDTIQNIFQTIRFKAPPEFKHFLDHSDWGRTKDLIYVGNQRGPFSPNRRYYVIDENFDMNAIFEFDPKRNIRRVVDVICYLGPIKNAAMKRLGLKEQPTEEDWVPF